MRQKAFILVGIRDSMWASSGICTFVGHLVSIQTVDYTKSNTFQNFVGEKSFRTNVYFLQSSKCQNFVSFNHAKNAFFNKSKLNVFAAAQIEYGSNNMICH